jgi:hypothetical protein
MRTFVRSSKKQIVDGNNITTMPADWSEGDSTVDAGGAPIIHNETVDDGEAYIEMLLKIGYEEVTE